MLYYCLNESKKGRLLELEQVRKWKSVNVEENGFSSVNTEKEEEEEVSSPSFATFSGYLMNEACNVVG